MKKNIIICLFLGMFSCSGFLEELPKNSVTEKDAIKTVEDCGTAANGLYVFFKDKAYYGVNMSAVPNTLSDETLAIIGYSNVYVSLYDWTFSASTSETKNFWTLFYRVAANASFLLERIDDVPTTSANEKALKDYYKGQAYLARAIGHFDAVRCFAKAYNKNTASTDMGVPVVTKWEMNNKVRVSMEDTYKQIIADADSAYKYIKLDVADGTVNDGYFTKGTVEAFLAKVYLYMGDWENAITYSSKVIDNPKYSLTSGNAFKSMFLNDKGTELIWKVKYVTSDASSGNLGYYYYNNAFTTDPKPDFLPSNKILNMYDRTNDIRFSTFFKRATTTYGWEGFLVNKYPTNPVFAAGGPNFNGANMAKVFRLSEQYLIRAEAYSEMGGNDALALADLNALRAKRIEGYNPDTNLSGASLKEAIEEENIKEFAFEGHRWFDLKRKGKGFSRTPQDNAISGPTYDKLSIDGNDYRWLLPISQTEMNINKGMIQNPNY